MIDFNDDNLTPEERLGSFDLGTPDDETFLLEKKDVYPGDLPDFDSEQKSLAQAIAEKEAEEMRALGIEPPSVTSAEQIQPEEGESVWDFFDENSETQENATANQDDDYGYEAASESEEAYEDFNKPLLPGDDDEDEYNDNFDSGEESYIPDYEEPIPAPPPPAPKVQKPLDEVIQIDDELKFLLQGDLQKGKAKKAFSLDDDQPVDENFTLFANATSPLDKKVEAEAPEPVFIPAANEQTENNESEENKDKKEKKKREPMAMWKVIAITTAAMLLLFVLAGVAILNVLNNPALLSKFTGKEDTSKTELAHKAKAVKKVVPKPAAPKPEAPEHLEEDTSHQPAPAIAEEIVDDKNTIILEDGSRVKIDDGKPVKTHTKETAKPVAAKEIAHNAVKAKAVSEKPHQEQRVFIPNEYTAPKKKKDIPKVKNTFPVEEPYLKPEKQAKETSKTKNEIQTTGKARSDFGEFTIQIYSSPSKSDALEWQSKLMAKGISTSMTTQQIRGDTWYRIRYGKFASKDEAQAAVLKYGFNHSWIDRIK